MRRARRGQGGLGLVAFVSCVVVAQAFVLRGPLLMASAPPSKESSTADLFSLPRGERTLRILDTIANK
jgi:hypothetical protein